MVNNPILYAAIMILWLVALPVFLIMSSVYRIVTDAPLDILKLDL